MHILSVYLIAEDRIYLVQSFDTKKIGHCYACLPYNKVKLNSTMKIKIEISKQEPPHPSPPTSRRKRIEEQTHQAISIRYTADTHMELGLNLKLITRQDAYPNWEDKTSKQQLL